MTRWRTITAFDADEARYRIAGIGQRVRDVLIAHLSDPECCCPSRRTKLRLLARRRRSCP